MDRSEQAGGTGASAAAAAAAGQAGTSGGAAYVLVHGAWHGGWCWRMVAALLRAQGKAVFTPTLTGLGERKHLLSREITLATFIADVANLIEAEELQPVILVGHSHAGPVISGVADRMPGRIAQLVFLDAVVLQDGESAFGVLPPDTAAARRDLVAREGLGLALPVPPVAAFGIPEQHPLADWVRRRLTPHPVGSYESALQLAHPLGNGLPCTYIHCTNPVYAVLASSREWVRRQPGWAWREIATAHDAMVTAPAELATMLLDIGRAELRSPERSAPGAV